MKLILKNLNSNDYPVREYIYGEIPYLEVPHIP